MTLWLAGGIGAMLGYALRLYGETFGQHRCPWVWASSRCGLKEDHHGPHRTGVWPDHNWHERKG